MGTRTHTSQSTRVRTHARPHAPTHARTHAHAHAQPPSNSKALLTLSKLDDWGAAPAPAPLAAATTDPEALAGQLLERLLARAHTEVGLPVLPHAQRLRSGARGFGVPFLRGLLRFLERHGANELEMSELCKQPGLAVSVCRLTASTGLSLVESCVLVAAEEEVDASTLFGHADTFFSYSWNGTRVCDMAAAAERGVEQLAAAEGKGEAGARPTRRLWLDMLCASQNLLAVRGAPHQPPSCPAPRLA